MAHSVTVLSFGNRVSRVISVSPLPGCSCTSDELPACFEAVLCSPAFSFRAEDGLALQVIVLFTLLVVSGFVMVGVVMFRNTV